MVTGVQAASLGALSLGLWFRVSIDMGLSFQVVVALGKSSVCGACKQIRRFTSTSAAQIGV